MIHVKEMNSCIKKITKEQGQRYAVKRNRTNIPCESSISCPYPCGRYGKFRTMNAHVIADHNMFSILFCKLCNFKCWKLDCYLDHGRGTHDTREYTDQEP